MRAARRRPGIVALGLTIVIEITAIGSSSDDEPEGLNPFETPAQAVRDESVPGYVELSSGQVVTGQVALKKGAGLRILDRREQRLREIPLRAVRRVECSIARAWMEREWRFQENASDRKVYTGRSYPVREYVHTLTLVDGTSFRGDLSALIHVEADPAPAGPRGKAAEPLRFVLHQRDKGSVGSNLASLIYVRAVVLGKAALEEGRSRNARAGPRTSRAPASSRAEALPKSR
ncbi:MAG: hypothetical protein U0794_17545 [Isosphaeraceae bacterium]